jgi:hypothetical protein
MFGSPPFLPELLIVAVLMAVPFALRAARKAQSSRRTHRRLQELRRLR